MKVTALEEYGLRCMLSFVRQGHETPLTLPEISSREGLSIPYVGKLLMILKKAGLVKAVRGRNGGYMLAKKPREMKLGEIFSALGDPLYGTHHCERYSGDNDCCVHKEDCKVKTIWSAFDSFISGALEKTTLADLASGDYNFFESEKKQETKEN